MPYIGNQPGTGVRNRFIYTATASQTTFSGADNNSKTLKYADSNYIDVYLNGVCLEPGTDYTASTKTSVVLTQAASLGDTLKIIAYDVASMDDSISKADGGTFESSVTFADGADIITASKGTDNVRLGEGAGDSIASGGTNNVVIGKDAGTAITTGDNNTFLGYNSGVATTTGGDSVAIGTSALAAQTTGGDNVAIGHLALSTLTTAGNNVAIGDRAMSANTSGENNVAVGTLAMDANTTGEQNVAIGRDALGANTTGLGNTAVGYSALEANTSANNNTAVGRDALDACTTGGANTAVGREALTKVTTGAYNTTVGLEAGKEVTTGTFNVAVGWRALYAATAGDHNVAIGSYSQYSSLGEYNTSIGQETMINSTSGDFNTALGYKAAEDMTSSSDKNTCVGAYAGDDMTTGAQNNIFIGYDATSYSGGSDGQICLGTSVTSIGGYYTTLGRNDVGRVYNEYLSNASWTRTSDERIKKDIQTNTDCGLDFINDLRTVTYKWKAPSEHPEEFVSYDPEQTEPLYKNKMYGFIAQEVKSAMDTHNITDFKGWHVTSEDQGSQQGISYEMFVMPLVKAVQELSAKNDALEARIAALEAE